MFGDERIGKYRIVEVLARGSCGTVIYLGFDEEAERHVAIKVSRKLAAPKNVEILLEGVPSFAKFDHPHIVPIYEIGRTEEGKHYVVSKFIEGHSLREKIRDGRPSPEESARLVATIAQARHYLHQHGVVHGDVKPSNILLETTTGKPFVIGFELANGATDDKDGVILGNPSYMSPEQVRGESHLSDGRTDIFSLGVIFYELLTGIRPFRNNSSIKLINEIISAEPVSPRKLNGAVPVELDRICLKALAKKPSDRQSTAEELAHDLLHWQTTPKWSWLSRFRRR